MFSLGENIKKYRKKNKLTQAELGEKIGKSERTIRGYEADTTSPTTDIIIKIAEALGTTFVDLTMNIDEKMSDFEILNFKNANKLSSEQLEFASYVLDYMRNKHFSEYTLNEFKEEFKNFDVSEFVENVENNALIKLQNYLISNYQKQK